MLFFVNNIFAIIFFFCLYFFVEKNRRKTKKNKKFFGEVNTRRSRIMQGGGCPLLPCLRCVSTGYVLHGLYYSNNIKTTHIFSLFDILNNRVKNRRERRKRR